MSTPTPFLGVGAEIYALALLTSIGKALDEEDQEWLSAHLSQLPEYLASPEGGKVMASVVNCYRAHMQYVARKRLE
jgi:hypothetical protein